MKCETCLRLEQAYHAAVAELHGANERVRKAKQGSVDSALARRDAQERLRKLMTAETVLQAHKGAHLSSMPSVSSPVRNAIRF